MRLHAFKILYNYYFHDVLNPIKCTRTKKSIKNIEIGLKTRSK